MNQLALKNRDREWLDYYQEFDYFSASTVRDGCYPRIMERERPTGKAIVLVHGLSDSPYFHPTAFCQTDLCCTFRE
jgi:hypothetical protein